MKKDKIDTVDKASEFWHEYRRDLAALRQRFTWREAEYLDLVKPVLMRNVEAARTVLLRETGLDLKTGAQLFLPPDPAALIHRRAWWENVERYGQDYLQVGRAVARAMEAARGEGKDPVLEGYAMFFWAMEHVLAAGTVFLMLDTDGDEKEHTALLTAGWADAGICLQGPQAGRLRAALLAEDKDPRQRLRQELPGAVLDAVQQWRPGQELPMGERARPRPGKQTAGRQERTLLSRITRLIECQDASAGRARSLLVHTQAEQWQASATRRAAQGVQNDLRGPSRAAAKFQVLWADLVQRAHLGPHEAQIAAYVGSNLGCLDVRPDRRLHLRRGTQVEMARVLERPAVQVRQETLRMLRKLEKAQLETAR